MGRQTITSEQWLAAVASVDDNPAVRDLARQTLEEFRSMREQLVSVRTALRVEGDPVPAASALRRKAGALAARVYELEQERESAPALRRVGW